MTNGGNGSESIFSVHRGGACAPPHEGDGVAIGCEGEKGGLEAVFSSRSHFERSINLCQHLICGQWRRSSQVKVS